ncbi:hypothetical protein K9N08_02405 [Candidatus Gracilibacteria bacterium]|nr:hypothetical protein [Candidatus Gracilibacteria bacterium]MCF7856387.1 hypothetical protein [Candidatus Gracilibacteria bacterium]MCF7896817.1 hypothetical protein [Candidatus Gracilibacteria bacterium]
MKNSFLKIFSAIAILLLLPACFGGGGDAEDTTEAAETVFKKEIPKIFYISKSASECRTIFFSCPTGRAPFTDDAGCGCRESDESFNEEKEGLGNMIRDKLARELLQPKCDGGVFAEFVYIDEGEVSTGNLNYDVWAIAREFCENGDAGATFDGPVAFDVEVTEFSRIVKGYQTVSASDTAAVQAAFTPKAAEWILAEENSARDQVIEELQGNIQMRLNRLQNEITANQKARALAEELATGDEEVAEPVVEENVEAEAEAAAEPAGDEETVVEEVEQPVEG